MKKENYIEKFTKEVSENRAKILDDFAKVYLASRWQDCRKIDLRRLELVEDRSEMPQKITYYFRFKKGKLKDH